MRKKQTALLVVLGLIGLLVLAACGAGSPPGQDEAQAPQSATEVFPATEAAAPTESPQAVPPGETPTEPAAEAPAAVVSFASEVLPIIESRCVNCHGGERIEEGLLLRTYEEILAGSENGAVIVPGDAASSLLVELVATQEMPKRGPKLTPPQVQLITDWVNNGAPNN